MTYEECEQLVTAFEQATLLKNETVLDDEYRKIAGNCGTPEQIRKLADHIRATGEVG